MAEQVDLSAPVSRPSTASYRLQRITLDLDAPSVYVHGNFSGATSLVKAVYNRLIADGVLAGSVSGTPQ